jgi:hypothetical protein
VHAILNVDGLGDWDLARFAATFETHHSVVSGDIHESRNLSSGHFPTYAVCRVKLPTIHEDMKFALRDNEVHAIFYVDRFGDWDLARLRTTFETHHSIIWGYIHESGNLAASHFREDPLRLVELALVDKDMKVFALMYCFIHFNLLELEPPTLYNEYRTIRHRI